MSGTLWSQFWCLRQSQFHSQRTLDTLLLQHVSPWVALNSLHSFLFLPRYTAKSSKARTISGFAHYWFLCIGHRPSAQVEAKKIFLEWRKSMNKWKYEKTNEREKSWTSLSIPSKRDGTRRTLCVLIVKWLLNHRSKPETPRGCGVIYCKKSYRSWSSLG